MFTVAKGSDLTHFTCALHDHLFIRVVVETHVRESEQLSGAPVASVCLNPAVFNREVQRF